MPSVSAWSDGMHSERFEKNDNSATGNTGVLYRRVFLHKKRNMAISIIKEGDESENM